MDTPDQRLFTRWFSEFSATIERDEKSHLHD
jgi:hypothetical protein